ncbi:hypothetical protein BGZ76_008929, partial [Entomortierella beljakovae]
MEQDGGYMLSGPGQPLSISDLAFVDDTTWIARSHQHMQAYLDTATSFFKLNSIEINAKKTVVATLNSLDKDQPVVFGTPVEELHAVHKDELIRILGVWINASGNTTPVNNHIRTEISSICNILSNKAVTDRQAALIVNSVLIPRITYRLAVHVLPPSTLKQLNG